MSDEIHKFSNQQKYVKRFIQEKNELNNIVYFSFALKIKVYTLKGILCGHTGVKHKDKLKQTFIYNLFYQNVNEQPCQHSSSLQYGNILAA